MEGILLFFMLPSTRTVQTSKLYIGKLSFDRLGTDQYKNRIFITIKHYTNLKGS